MTRRTTRPDTDGTARALLLREADLLDATDWDGWLALLAEDFRYWVPLEPSAVSPDDAPSLIDEDLTLVRMRLRRYAHSHAFGRERSRTTLHQLGAIRAEKEGDGISVTAQQVVHEFHADRLSLFPGTLKLRIVPTQAGWRISRREVRLIAMTGIFDPIEIIF